MPIGLLLGADGTIWKVEGTSVFAIDCAYAAQGAGREMAYGALHAGATAEEAAQVCANFHVWCGGAIQVERI